MGDKPKNINDIDERTLVQKCIEDERSYQELFYRKFAKAMFHVCKTYTDDRDEAMDFLQDGFIEVFRKLDNFRFEGSLEGWVRRVIVYKTIDALRKKKRYQEVMSDFDADIITPADEFEFEEDLTTADQIRGMVNSLPGKAGLILKLYVIEGLTHKEIADHLEISEGTSKSQLNRARTLLKANLNRE